MNLILSGCFYLHAHNRQLALSGAHVVMAVRRPKVAQEFILKWQNENSETGRPLNAEVMSKALATGSWLVNEGF